MFRDGDDHSNRCPVFCFFQFKTILMEGPVLSSFNGARGQC